jgi:hypothetical protein
LLINLVAFTGDGCSCLWYISVESNSSIYERIKEIWK